MNGREMIFGRQGVSASDLLPENPPRPRSAPPRLDLLGVGISLTTYQGVVDLAIDWARQGRPGLFDFMPVHGVVVAARHRHFREAMRAFDVVAPDGQPVRWALNYMQNANLPERVYGPTCMLWLCEAAARNDVSIYLFGATPDVTAALSARLCALFPTLSVAGRESPPFRDLTEDEDRAVVDRINASGAGLLFIGLGCPKQEMFAFHHRDLLRPVQLCVGAAFDFHAGNKRMAPAWMQRRGLEWLFRLWCEPRRLARRYAVTNTLYLAMLGRELVRHKLGRR